MERGKYFYSYGTGRFYGTKKQVIESAKKQSEIFGEIVEIKKTKTGKTVKDIDNRFAHCDKRKSK